MRKIELIPTNLVYLMTYGRILTDRTNGFVVAGDPPTVTPQMQRIGVNHDTGKPYVYKDQALKDAENHYLEATAPYAPDEPWSGPVRLTVLYVFDETRKKYREEAPQVPGHYRVEKPDADNLTKLLTDQLAAARDYIYRDGHRIQIGKRPFVVNDSQIVDVRAIKIWDSSRAGTYIILEKLPESVLGPTAAEAAQPAA